ncbi:MAG: hypothetical protein LQ349_008114 [Xanthoria aureola]|nr:MAG: hypothetical protein LQ349_008114 [Xanthoria aureola]
MVKYGLRLVAVYAVLVLGLPLSPILAAPARDSPGVHCQNAPYTQIVAGDMTPARKRGDVPAPLILCAPESRTYIALTPGLPADTRQIRPVVISAYQRILNITGPLHEDRIISFSSGWIFNTTIGAYSLKVKNVGVANTRHRMWWSRPVNTVPRHMTYLELENALLALYTHLNERGWRQAQFEIWDAGREVGFATLGPEL